MSIQNQNIVSQKTFDAIIKDLTLAIEPSKRTRKHKEKIKDLDRNKEIEALVVKFLEDVRVELDSMENYVGPTNWQ